MAFRSTSPRTRPYTPGPSCGLLLDIGVPLHGNQSTPEEARRIPPGLRSVGSPSPLRPCTPAGGGGVIQSNKPALSQGGVPGTCCVQDHHIRPAVSSSCDTTTMRSCLATVHCLYSPGNASQFSNHSALESEGPIHARPPPPSALAPRNRLAKQRNCMCHPH